MRPRRLGPYEFEQLLGTGSMGEVYLARDARHHDRRVAVKLLPESLGADREFMARFEREARITAQLSEPHVIPVHSYGTIEGRPFIEMRLVLGSDLHQLLRRSGPLAPERAVALVAQAAAALDAAHAEELVHRDVKPSNMLVTPQDFLYVVDFGIARAHGTSNTALTGTGVAIGTLQYMAPERFLGREFDARTDLYSLTCVLVECLTGAPPFRGEELPALLYAHVSLDPPRLTSVVPDIPPGMDDVVARGMAKDPTDRFPTAGALVAAAMEALQAHRPGPASSGAGSRVGGPSALDASATAPWHDRPPVPARGAGPAGGTDASPLGAPRRTALVAAGVLVLVTVLVLSVLYLTDVGDDADAGESAASSSSSSTAAAATTGPATPLPSVPTPVLAGAITEALDNPHDIALSPDGARAYVADANGGRLQVIDIDGQAVVDSIPISQGPPQYVTLSPDGTKAYVTTSRDRRTDLHLLVVDLAARTVEHDEPVDLYPLKPTVSPDGSTVYVPLHDQGRVEIFDAEGIPVGRFEVPRNPHSVVLSADGRTGYVANHESNVITLWDMQTLQPIGGEITAGSAPHRLALSPDGQQIAVVNFLSSDVWLYRTSDLSAPQQVAVGRNPQDVAYAPDGRHVYTVNLDDDSISVVDLQTLEVVPVPVGNEPTSIVVRADGGQAFVTVSEPPEGAPQGSAGSVAVLDTAG
ncbi:serine/threonine-protein kinase [Geodermatophilus sp. SYSU D00758]